MNYKTSINLTKIVFPFAFALMLVGCGGPSQGTIVSEEPSDEPANSQPMSDRIRIIDPCGDGPGHDEVVLIFPGGEVMAWYLDLGLTLLEPGVVYRTTDTQRCLFMVDPETNEVVEID